MSKGIYCTCDSTRKEKMKNWRVLVRNGNYSHFESPKGQFHPSKYSSITCMKCGAIWRSKAKYINKLEDYKVN